MTEQRALAMRVWAVAIIVGITTSIIPCGQAHAAGQRGQADVACVVVGLRMAKMTTPQQRAAGMILAAYYLGRLDVEFQRYANIEGLIEQEAGRMTLAEFRTDAIRCGKALQQKGVEIQRIGAIVHGQHGAVTK